MASEVISVPTRILVVDDEVQITRVLRAYLEQAGFAVSTAYDGREALRLARQESPDLIILDLMLPEVDGLDVCRALRKESGVPIIMLTARVEETDRVIGLELGADDYVTKPFSPRELLARIRAVLRRRAPEQVSDSVTIGDLALDAGTYRVTFHGQPLKVGPTEFKLLHFFMKHSERVHSRSQLLDKVWGDHVFIEERTVDVHVKRLREALGAAGVMVETVRGAGYRLTAQPPALLRA